jgi:hypothetical protein
LKLPELLVSSEYIPFSLRLKSNISSKKSANKPAEKEKKKTLMNRAVITREMSRKRNPSMTLLWPMAILMLPQRQASVLGERK